MTNFQYFPYLVKKSFKPNLKAGKVVIFYRETGITFQSEGPGTIIACLRMFVRAYGSE